MSMKKDYKEEAFEKVEKEVFGGEADIDTPKFEPLHIGKLMSKEFPETAWTVEKLIPAGGITVISGSPASNKTWMVLYMITKIAKGEPVFDKFMTQKAGVLLVDEENGERLLQHRLKKLLKDTDIPVYTISLGGFVLTKDTVEELLNFCKEKEIGVIIFDSLIRIHSADENDASKMAQVFKILKEFNKNDITVIFTHHHRKQGFLKSDPAQSMRGSSDILASVDCHLAVDKKRKDELRIDQTKLRQEEEIMPFKLTIVSDDDSFLFEYAGEVDEVATKKEVAKENIRNLLEKEDKAFYQKELFEALKEGGLDVGQATFRDALNEMVEKEGLYTQKGKGNATYYSLKPFPEEEEEINAEELF